MTVYIAGPMTGLPEFNHPEFNRVAEVLRGRGLEVINPAEFFGGDTTREHREYMREAVASLLEAEALAFLPGHENSRGATLELQIAYALGLEVFPAP